MSLNDRKLTILYGSQTGTAQEVADRLWRDAKRFHFSGPSQAMDDYNVTQLIHESIVVFVCSTTGDGQAPDNMKRFWKFLLRRNLPVDSLKGLRFGVLGLGDSSYAKFNFTAKKLYRRLLQLGAHALLELGLADDQHDLGADAVVDPWTEKLLEKVLCICPLPSGVLSLDKTELFPARWEVTVEKDEAGNIEGNQLESINIDRHNISKDNILFVTLQKNLRTTSDDHFQDVRLLQFSGSEIQYKPGDVLMTCPQNFPEYVDQFFEIISDNPNCNWNPNTKLKIIERFADAPVPKIFQKLVVFKDLVEKYWDLSKVPHRYFFDLLSHFTTSELEKDKLQEFVSSQGQEELYNYCNRPRRKVLEVLMDFPFAAKNIPLEYMFELFQPIKPRAFSIASSPSKHKDNIHILVAVVKYYTKLLAPRLGLCSNWLSSLSEGQSIPVWIQNGTFVFPQSPDIPVIMVGPGTGVAPFRSFIQERVSNGTAKADILYLFFGCRNCKGDFHCSEEWLSLQSNNQLTIFCAFSRDQDEKIYVQHIMKQQASLLWNLLHDQNASLYVAGRSDGMPAAIKDVLIHDIAEECGHFSKEQSSQWFVKLETSGRYQTETWS